MHRLPRAADLTTPRSAPNGHNLARGNTGTWEGPHLKCENYFDSRGRPLTPPNPRGLGLGVGGGLSEYLALEEEPTFLLKLAERVKATSHSGTSTMTCGLCTKPRPLCTPTHSRRSEISRALPSSRPPWKSTGQTASGLGGRGKGLAGQVPGEGQAERKGCKGVSALSRPHGTSSERAPVKGR